MGKMEGLFVLLVLLSFGSISACPYTCSCSLMLTECFLNTCAGDLPFEETYVLEIHGHLCERHREILASSPTFANTIIRLHDDNCLGVPNCR